MQPDIRGFIDDLQPAILGRLHQVAGDLGLAVNRDMLAGQFKCVDPDQSLTVCKAKAFLEQAFLVEPRIEPEPV